MTQDNSIADGSTNDSGNDSGTIALQALVWVLQDGPRTDRLLGLTGLTGDQLRQRIMEPAIHLAVLDYLMGYEPDLIACAQALDLPLTRMVSAHTSLSS